jgi:hypothetical protein
MHVFDGSATEDRIRAGVAEEKETAKNLATAFALCGPLRDSDDESVASEARVISVTKEDTTTSAPYSLAAGELSVPVPNAYRLALFG